MGFFFSYTFLSAVGFRGAAVANDCDATHAGALGTHANSHTGNPHCDGNGQHPADAATPPFMRPSARATRGQRYSTSGATAVSVQGRTRTFGQAAPR